MASSSSSCCCCTGAKNLSGNRPVTIVEIRMTTAIVDVAAPPGDAVHDHIIVGKNGRASLKGMKLS